MVASLLVKDQTELTLKRKVIGLTTLIEIHGLNCGLMILLSNWAMNHHIL
jgi:hypothetical protein